MATGSTEEPKDAYLDREAYRLDGRVVVITGASAGIGKETLRDLVLRGATVVQGNRDLEKSEKVLAALRSEEKENAIPEDRVITKKLDLCDLSSVREFAEQVKKEYPVIDILINNAGKMGGPRVVTKDGFESQFQTNHLSHFLITHLLMDNILASPNKPRILNISSRAHTNGKINLDDLQFEKSYPAQGFGAYCASKLLNVLFTKSLAEKYAGKVNAYAIHPGVVKTELGRSSWIANCLYKINFLAKDERSGALTTIYCAVSNKAGTESGLYYADSREVEPSKAALDLEMAQKVWDKSCELLNITWNVQ